MTEQHDHDMVTRAITEDEQGAEETRCECGQLIAKLRQGGIELKCKRCKRIVLIPFTSIEGWTALSTPTSSRFRKGGVATTDER